MDATVTVSPLYIVTLFYLLGTYGKYTWGMQISQISASKFETVQERLSDVVMTMMIICERSK